MIYLTISKLEAMFRLQRLVSQSDCRYFQTGSIHPSQLVDVLLHFERKYSVSNDKNTRKRTSRAGEPNWHLVFWYDVTKAKEFNYYLMTNGYDEKKYPNEHKNLLLTENLEDIYNGDLLTFGRYVLGQYVEYQDHKVNPRNGKLVTVAESYEYRYPEKTALFFKPSDFNYLIPPKEAIEKSKAVLALIEEIKTDKTALAEMSKTDDGYAVVKERLDANKKAFSGHFNDIKEVGNKYSKMEKYNGSDLDLISKEHPNFRKDLDYSQIQTSLENDIKLLHKQKNRLSRAYFIEFLGRATTLENLEDMEHGALVELWLKIETRRITLYYNRLCENRSRKVRWTWYLRDGSVYDIRSQLRLAIKHMGRNTDDLVQAIRAVGRMAGFRGVRHQLGKLLAKAKRDAKHAYPKLYSHLNLNMNMNYIRVIPITIHSIKQYHDECITASIKHERRKEMLSKQEANRKALRQSLRDGNEHFKNAPVALLDQFINEHIKEKLEKVTNDDIVRFMIKNDAMDAKYIDFNKVQHLITAKNDLRVNTENMYEEGHSKTVLKKIEGQAKARQIKEHILKKQASQSSTDASQSSTDASQSSTDVSPSKPNEPESETNIKDPATDIKEIATEALTSETKLEDTDTNK